MDSIPQGFRLPTEAETNYKNFRTLLGKVVLVNYDTGYFPGKITRLGKKLVIIQYYGEAYDDKIEEDIKDGIWIYDSSEEIFMEAYPQYKDAKRNKTTKLTYNEMVIEALYAINDKNGTNIQTIRRYIEQNYSSIAQKASFHSLTKKAIETNVASGKIERVSSGKYTLSKNERERIRDEEIGFERPSKEALAGRGDKLYKLPKTAFKRSESRDDVQTPAILEMNRTLRQQKIILENKRDEYLKEKMELLVPFLPERGNYFQRREQGIFDTDDVKDKTTNFPFPLHSEFIDLETNKKARSYLSDPVLLPTAAVAGTKHTTQPSEFSSDDTKPVVISPTESYFMFKATGVISKTISKRGPNMLTLAGTAFNPKSLFLDTRSALLNPESATSSSSSSVSTLKKANKINEKNFVINEQDDGKLFGKQKDSDIDYGLKVHDSGTTDFGFDDAEIAKAQTAYHLYSRAVSADVKRRLEEAGKIGNLGAVVKVVSDQWKSLSESEREPYERQEALDRKRYEEECELRDEAVLRQQEERRAKNALVESTALPEGLTRRGDPKVKPMPFAKSTSSSQQRELPIMHLLSDDASSLGMKIEGTGGMFDGYEVTWPGRRLPEGIHYCHLNPATLLSTVEVIEAPSDLNEEPEVAQPEQQELQEREGVSTVSHEETAIISLTPTDGIVNPTDTTDAQIGHEAAAPVNLPKPKAVPKVTLKVVCPVDWSHVYFLEKTRKVKQEDEDDEDDEDEENDHDVDTVDDGPLYLTALREADGTFVPNPKPLWKHTFPYAKRATIPVSNLVEIAYKCPNSGQHCTIVREYCDKGLYKECVVRALKETVKKFPELKNIAEDFLKGMRPKADAPTLPSSMDNKVEASFAAGSEATADAPGDTEEPQLDANVALNESSMAVNASMDGVQILSKPRQLTAELHEHQIQGISWMVHMYNKGMSMLLGDQMGLGKTIQSIGFICYLRFRQIPKQQGPFLVVMPLSVLSNWMAEFEKFCPQLKVVRFHGPKSERNRIKAEEIHDLEEFDVLLTTYEMLVSEANFFRRRYVWAAVIVDEGHRLKNEKSQLSEKLRSVPAVSRIILSGTPLQNNLRELWALIHFLQPDIFTANTAEKFEEGFDLAKGRIDQTILRKARQLLSVFMLRRLKEQIAIKLPSKRETTILVPLTEDQKDWYKKLLCGLDSTAIEVVMNISENDIDGTGLQKSKSDSSVINLEGAPPPAKKQKLPSSSSSSSMDAMNAKPVENDWRKLMNLLLQLRKVCNHIYLMPDAEPEIRSEEIVNGSGKLKMLDRMLPRLQQDGHRVLIFSQFTSMLDILEEYCDLRGHAYVRLDGETNRVQRRLDVRRYNAPNSPLFIFLISTRAGGLGLNLASADTVILYDSDWNPQVDLQAMERAHRIGQTKPVRIYRLICSGSVEERMITRAGKKLFLNAMVGESIADADDVINESSENDASAALGIGGSAISKSEIASLIRFGANAVIESTAQDNEEMNDAQLDRLLERRDGKDGRDSYDDEHTVVNASDNESALVENIMREEVDLRQLGNMIYNKKKAITSKERKGLAAELNVDSSLLEDDFDINNLAGPLAKRVSKQRIMMVSGKGTGYGGAVPMLAENQAVEEVEKIQEEKKNRVWNHMCFCSICGTSKSVRPTQALNVLQPCTHCPRTFHVDCLYSNRLEHSGKGTFVCTHHKCSSCSRNTAAAGGLLFRCTSCLTAYCEDCLPQDEIEGLGRHRAFEDVGYVSKQAYYIRCPSCCTSDGVDAKGVYGDAKGDRGDGGLMLPTQEIRVYHAEVKDQEDIDWLHDQETKKIAKKLKKVGSPTGKVSQKALKASDESSKKKCGKDINVKVKGKPESSPKKRSINSPTDKRGPGRPRKDDETPANKKQKKK